MTDISQDPSSPIPADEPILINNVPVMARRATVKWKGVPIRGQQKRQQDDGSWIMVALEKHPRFDIGHEFVAQESEITWDDQA